MDDGKIIIKAQIDSSGVDQDTKELEGKVTKSANNLSGIIKGIGFTALAAKATQTAIKFAKEVSEATESASSKLKAASTLYQGVAVDQNNLLKKLSAISNETGASLETLGQSVYDALSAGVKPTEDMAEVLQVVSASAKLAKGGFTDTSTALSSTMKVLNAYSMSMDNLDKVQGILVQTQNSGITTVDELGASLAQVVPTAASFGVSFENVGAAIAEMTKQGTKTAQATTALNAIIAELGKNGTTASKNLKAAAEAAGMADTDFKSMLESGMSISEILQIMADNAESNGLSMVDMFSSIEAGKGALQLTGKAGEDFNDIMKSMESSAGLVQDAFEKTVDPTEQLNAAWNTLLVTIGTKFKPSADGVKKTLADMLTSLSGQKTAGDKLKTSYEDLKLALNNYKTASEDAIEKTDALTLSMKAQRKAELQTALWNASEAYVKSSRSIEIYTEKQKKAQEQYDDTTEAIEKYTKKTGKSIDWLMENMYDSEELFKVFYSGYGESANAFMESFLTQANKRIAAQKDEIEYSTKLAEAQVDEASFIDVLTKGYIDNNEATMMLLKTYPELKSRVLANVSAYKQAEKEAKAAAEEQAKLNSTVKEGTETSKESSSEAEEEVDVYKQLTEEISAMKTEHERLERASNLTNESLITNAEKSRDMLDIYKKYVQLGVDPTTEAMEDLMREIKLLNPAVDEQAEYQKSLSSEMKKAKTEAERLQNAGTVLGQSLFDNEKYINTLTSIYEKYVKLGVSPTCSAMRELNKLIDEANSKKTPTVVEGDNGKTKQNVDNNPTEYQKNYASLQKEIGKVTTEYYNLKVASNVIGKELYDQNKEVSDLTDIYIKYVKLGINPSSTAMQTLLTLINRLGSTVEEQIEVEEEQVEAQKEVVDIEKLLKKESDELVDKYMNLMFAQDDFAKSLFDEDKAISEMTSLYKKYVEMGIDPTCDAMKDLKYWIEAFGESTDDADDIWNKFGKDLKKVGVDSIESIVKGSLSSFETLGEFIANKDDQLKELDEKIKEIEGDTGTLTEAEHTLEAARLEEQLATQRGDQKAIEDAKAKVVAAERNYNAINETLGSLKSQKESVEDNTEAWNAFGKASLEALASTLEGIGGQLAAMAISTYPNFAQMALSATGSAAAYVTAGILKSQAQKFATGGIVQGDSYTGDNIPIRANAGELILNVAQQETLARILEASVAMAELQASGGNGNGITVNLDGATIYGLDEPAVGRAIYENIQNLKYEGVI